MTRIDRARYLGALAASLLAVSVFAPMMAVSLREGTLWRPFTSEIRVVHLILAGGAAVASLRGAFGVAAFFGAFALTSGLVLLALTAHGVLEARVQAWLRPGWGFVPLLAAGLALATLPWWSRAGQASERPPA